LQETLTSPSYDLTTVVFSIDDLYLPHDEQVALARSHPTNPLVQHRGVPGTHDIRAGAQLLQALARQETDVSLPSYDKSAFSGAGDRRPRSEWTIVNPGGRRPVDVVIMEGWCVGFRALPDEELRSRWRSAHEKATSAAGSDEYEGQLGRVKLEDVAFINDSLRAYDDLTDKLAALIYM
jgi:D-glycerate 3-kinase